MNSSQYIRFIKEIINAYSDEQLIDLTINSLLEYERYKSDANKTLAINFCGMMMMKLSKQDLEMIHETFQHFQAFNNLTNIINQKENQ